MTCQKIRDYIYLYSYNELNEQERGTVETHVASCAECSALLERIQQSGTLFTQAYHVPPTPDWEGSWQKIQQRLAVNSSLPQGNVFVRRPALLWVGALAASIAIFVVGLFVGFLLKPNTQTKMLQVKTQPPTQSTHQADYFAQDFQEHLDNIKPVILEYANYLQHADDQPNKNLQIEKQMVIELLIHNQLLLCRLPDHDNPVMVQLLNELQDILTRIAAMTLDDPEEISVIKEMIAQKRLIFKMEALRPIRQKEIRL